LDADVLTVMDEIAASEPAIRNAKVEGCIDASFMTKLDRSGYIDGLYRNR